MEIGLNNSEEWKSGKRDRLQIFYFESMFVSEGHQAGGFENSIIRMILYPSLVSY